MKKLIQSIRRIFGREKTVEHSVVFAGKEVKISSHGEPDTPPQQFVDNNAVACGICGDMMLPGEKLWLFIPEEEDAFKKPGVLAVGEGTGRSLVGCLGWDCCPTAGLMCGELGLGRVVLPFESPMQKAIRTKEPIVVSNVSAYRG